jgi:hypothetical protein
VKNSGTHVPGQHPESQHDATRSGLDRERMC